MAEPTQMIIVAIPTSINLDDSSSKDGKSWQQILALLRKVSGYKRLYWGRQVETLENVQLHIVRGLLQQHFDFLSSPGYTEFGKLLLTITSSTPTIRHALISEFSISCKSLGKGAPVTGTAIYLSTTTAWDMAWANWVSIVQHVPGFMGIAGGPVIEAVNGCERGFIALVGWENVEVHDAYHHTKHFRDRRRILLDPAKDGYAYYGHIAFAHNEGEETGRLRL